MQKLAFHAFNAPHVMVRVSKKQILHRVTVFFFLLKVPMLRKQLLDIFLDIFQSSRFLLIGVLIDALLECVFNFFDITQLFIPATKLNKIFEEDNCPAMVVRANAFHLVGEELLVKMDQLLPQSKLNP